MPEPVPSGRQVGWQIFRRQEVDAPLLGFKAMMEWFLVDGDQPGGVVSGVERSTADD